MTGATRRSLVATLLAAFTCVALLSGQDRPAAQPVRLLRKAGAGPVFYLTWARKATPDDQSALNEAYMRAAGANRAILAPVGIAWSEVCQRDRSIDLFYADGAHPSAAGTYLAACTFYATIFQQTPRGPAGQARRASGQHRHGQIEADQTVVLVDLASREAQALQAAGWAAWREIR